MEKLLNEMTVTLKLKRIDICDLLIACTATYHSSGAQKWADLHDKLEEILKQFDESKGY